jgi:hypothetical protein
MRGLTAASPIVVPPTPRYDAVYALSMARVQARYGQHLGRSAYVISVQYGYARVVAKGASRPAHPFNSKQLLWVVTYADPTAKAPGPGTRASGSRCPETEFFIDAATGSSLGTECLYREPS